MSANLYDETLANRILNRLAQLEKQIADLRTNQVKLLIPETHIQGHPQWDNSWTQLSTYQDVVGSTRQIDFDVYKNHDYHFEMIAKTDAGTGFYKVVNVDTGQDLAGSEISTTSTLPIRLRSGVITKPTGVVNIKIQHRIQGGNGSTHFVNSIMSDHIFKVP